jgi:hypothetical protein
VYSTAPLPNKVRVSLETAVAQGVKITTVLFRTARAVKTSVVCGRLRAVFFNCLRLPVSDYVGTVNRYAQQLGRLRRLRSSHEEVQVSGFSLGFLVECSGRG